MAKKKFYVSVTETLQRTVCVMADNEEDAKDKVESAYQANKIVLNGDDYLEDSAHVEVEESDLYEGLGNDFQLIK